MNMQIRAHASSQAGRANEDIAGAAGRFAWIVDGASGVGAANLTSADTDASWLALTIDAILRERIEAGGDVGLDALIRHLESELARRFAVETSIVQGSDADMPSACLALISSDGIDDGEARVSAAVIGDVCVFAPVRNELFRWTDERLKPFEAKTLAELGRHPRETTEVPPSVLAQIRRNRNWLNREGGYYAVHPYLPWADRMLAFDLTIPAERPLVLATDGFLRLSDLFESMDENALYEAVTVGKASSLIESLRQLELQDPFGRRHLRVKTHDDATVLAVVPAR